MSEGLNGQCTATIHVGILLINGYIYSSYY